MTSHLKPIKVDVQVWENFIEAKKKCVIRSSINIKELVDWLQLIILK